MHRDVARHFHVNNDSSGDIVGRAFLGGYFGLV